MGKKGFTLVELLIALVVGAIIVSAAYAAMVMAQRTSAGLGRKVITQQDTRAVLDIMASEIRMASYNPITQPTTWTTIGAGVTACATVIPTIGTVTATAANKGILFADANNLYIAMDIGGPPDPMYPSDPKKYIPGTIGDVANEFIFYSYNTANSAITRSVSCGPNIAILGDTALGTRVINQTAGISLFQYYDRMGSLLPSPINIPDIRRIKITIVAETADNTAQKRTMIYATDILVRNHAAFMPSF